MKNTRNSKTILRIAGFIALIAVIVFSMAACADTFGGGNTGGGGGGGEGGEPTFSYGHVGKTSDNHDLIVMDPAMAASKTAGIEVVKGEEGGEDEGLELSATLVFTDLEAEYMPKAGDIIASEPTEAAPFGYLYRVTEVDTTTEDAGGGRAASSKTTTKVKAVTAQVDDAVKDADSRGSLAIDFSEEKSAGGITITATKDSIRFGIKKEKEGVEVEGFVMFSALVNMNVKIKGWSLQRFELTVNPRLQAELTASMEGKLEKEVEFPIFIKKLPSITFAVGLAPVLVPVVITPEIALVVHVSVNGDITVEAKLVKWDYSYVFGVQKDGKGPLTKISRDASKPAKYMESVQFDVSGKVRVEPELNVGLWLYGTAYAGAYGSFYAELAGEGSVYLNAHPGAKAEVSFTCGMVFGLKAQLRILKLEVGSVKVNIFNITWPIWKKEWQLAAKMPTASPTAGPPYTYTQYVTLSTETPGARIYYTTNDRDPTTSSTLYREEIAISKTTNIRAIAVKEGLANSPILTASYKILVGGDNPNTGVNWTAVPDSTFATNNINSIAYGNGTFVAGGGRGQMAYSSNGVNWTAVTTSTFQDYYSINSIAYGDGKFVAGGERGKIAYSSDGVNWTDVPEAYRTFDNGYIDGIAYGNGKFVTVGSREVSYGYTQGNRIAYSSDGITWTAVTNNTFNNSISGIAYGNNKFVAAISGIAYGNNKFVAVGEKGQMAYSSDGETWTAVTDSTFDTNYGISSIAYGNGTFVAGGRSAGDGPKMAYSSDGVNWTAVTNKPPFSYPNSIYDIAYGSGKFVAFSSSGKMAYSSDGVTWTAITVTALGSAFNGKICGIAYGSGTFVAVGDYGRMAYSP